MCTQRCWLSYGVADSSYKLLLHFVSPLEVSAFFLKSLISQPALCISERGNEIRNECYRYGYISEVCSFEMVYDITLIYQQTVCFFTADLVSWFRS